MLLSWSLRVLRWWNLPTVGRRFRNRRYHLLTYLILSYNKYTWFSSNRNAFLWRMFVNHPQKSNFFLNNYNYNATYLYNISAMIPYYYNNKDCFVHIGRAAEAKRRRGQGRSTKRISQSVVERVEETSGARTRTAGNGNCQRRVFVGTGRRQQPHHYRYGGWRRRGIARSVRADIQGCRWVIGF